MILVALTEIHLQVVRVGWVGKVEHVERHPRGTCCGARRRPLLHPGAWKAGGGVVRVVGARDLWWWWG